MTIERVQIGLAIVDRRRARVGDPLTIFPAVDAKKEPEPKRLSEMAEGDRVTLGLGARILPRFAKAVDMNRVAKSREY